MTDLPLDQDPRPVLPPALTKTAGWAWRLLAIGALVAIVAVVVFQLRVVTVPIFLAILFSTVLVPPVKFLERKGLRPALATTAVFLGVLLVLSGLVYLLASPIQDQFSDLGPQVSTAVDDVNNWLVTGPLELDQEQVDNYVQSIRDSAQANSGALRTGVVHSATLAAEIFTGIVLSIVLTFYFVKDGKSLVNGIVNLFPVRRRVLVRNSMDHVFWTLGGYLRGVAATGFVDAFFIGLALLLVGVPLVLPLVVLTFFGAFIPVVGATVAGALAAAIALVNGGPGDALLIILAVLVVQQIEGHILQPLLVGRAVALHPVIILASLGIGATVAGLLGAFVAVPLAAIVSAVWREVDKQTDTVEPLEDPEPEAIA